MIIPDVNVLVFALNSMTQITAPGPGHAIRLRSLIEAFGIAGNLTSDAHLAALALDLDARGCSYDRGFERFDGLRRIEP